MGGTRKTGANSDLGAPGKGSLERAVLWKKDAAMTRGHRSGLLVWGLERRGLIGYRGLKGSRARKRRGQLLTGQRAVTPAEREALLRHVASVSGQVVDLSGQVAADEGVSQLVLVNVPRVLKRQASGFKNMAAIISFGHTCGGSGIASPAAKSL